jgi:hypothetical protein
MYSFPIRFIAFQTDFLAEKLGNNGLFEINVQKCDCMRLNLERKASVQKKLPKPQE